MGIEKRRAPRKILIVDDDADILTVLRRMLDGSGYQVESAGSGPEALQKIGLFRPDVVLLDLMMPQMNGIDTLRRIHEMETEPRVIMITAFGDIGSYIDAIEWGAMEYINKPFERDELIQAIEKNSP
jgi:DNA-binding response OmpR family regulator